MAKAPPVDLDTEWWDSIQLIQANRAALWRLSRDFESDLATRELCWLLREESHLNDANRRLLIRIDDFCYKPEVDVCDGMTIHDVDPSVAAFMRKHIRDIDYLRSRLPWS